jgi:hypothetical protein
MASQVELFCDQGSDFSFTIDVKNDDSSPMNIAGYSFSSSIRKSYYSVHPTANLSISVSNTALGNVILTMNSATTANIKAGRYLYDVRMVDTSNVVTRVIEGIITVYPQVTKS